MAIRPHKLINRSERALIESRLLAPLRAWTERYAVIPNAPTCRVSVAGEEPNESVPPAATWWRCEYGGVRMLRLGLPADWQLGLPRLLLPAPVAETVEEQSGSLLRSLGSELLQELGERVLDALGAPQPLGPRRRQWQDEPAAAQAPPTLGRRAGEVVVTCGLAGTLFIHLLLEAAMIDAFLSASTPKPLRGLPPGHLSDALRAERVVLEAVLGKAELSAAELMSVRVGDVIKLNRALRDPLELYVRGGSVVCGARLGQQLGGPVLQLTSELPSVTHE